jgi:hypothetical protein
MFNDNPQMFPEKRKDGARKMLKLDKDIEIFTMRQIQLNVIRPPDYLDISTEIIKQLKNKDDK